MDTYYLGTHEPAWLTRANVPLFLSYHRMARRASWPKAQTNWALDSGGFSELTLRGTWTVPPAVYANAVSTWQRHIGLLQWAAIQDWMCEPLVLAKTGLTIADHQARTIESAHQLAELAPTVPWAPVLQGYTPDDYLRHADAYHHAGIDLHSAPAVGVGSVCRRQATREAFVIFEALHRTHPTLRLHAFGFKIQGLANVAPLIASADSLAWSFDARRLQRATCGSTTHKNCANCLTYAHHWYTHAITRMQGTTLRPPPPPRTPPTTRRNRCPSE